MRFCLLVVLTFVLSGCALPEADPARVTQADRAYELVRTRDVEGFRAIVPPARRNADLSQALAQLQDHLYASTPKSSQTVGWQSQTINGEASYRVLRLHDHPEGSVQADVIMTRKNAGPWQVDGVHVVRVPAQTVKAYEDEVGNARFTLVGKPVHQYLILLAACLSAILCLGSVIVAGLRRRWGWMILNIFGVGQFTLNWTTGAVAFQPLYFALFGAGFLRALSPTAPWLIMVAVPLPAILFWSLGKWRKKPARVKPAIEVFDA